MSGLGEIPGVLNVLLLDSDGKRVAVKYYDPKMKTLAQQMKFEKEVFTKTQRNNARGEAEIALLDHHVVVYKFCADLHFFVTAHVDENEIIVATVLNAFFDAVSLLLRGMLEKRSALENLDLVLLTIDELVASSSRRTQTSSLTGCRCAAWTVRPPGGTDAVAGARDRQGAAYANLLR